MKNRKTNQRTLILFFQPFLQVLNSLFLNLLLPGRYLKYLVFPFSILSPFSQEKPVLEICQISRCLFVHESSQEFSKRSQKKMQHKFRWSHNYLVEALERAGLYSLALSYPTRSPRLTGPSEWGRFTRTHIHLPSLVPPHTCDRPGLSYRSTALGVGIHTVFPILFHFCL